MHTNPPESISLNKYIRFTGLWSFGWIMMLGCVIAFVSCKPKDPIMNAAEQFHEAGFISKVYMDSLTLIRHSEGKLGRLDVIKAVAKSDSLYNRFSEPPYLYSEFFPSRDNPKPEFFMVNEKNLSFILKSGFLELDEYFYLHHFVFAEDTLTYPDAIMLIARTVASKEK